MTTSISLFPYQKAGSAWLSKQKYALLADEMGLGKSAQAITACDIISAESILVLCPAVARPNWVREFKRFSTNERNISVIASRSTPPPAQVTICSYDLSEFISKNTQFDVIIADESHYLKSIDAARTKSVLGKNGLVHRTKRFWALSGTPAPNHPGELWPLLFSMGITPLTYSTFIKKFCTYYIHLNRMQVTGAKLSAIDELKRNLHPVMLRRKKEDVLKELPPISFHDVFVEPGLVDLEVEHSFVPYIFPIDRRAELIEKLKTEEALITAALNVRITDTKKRYITDIAAMASSVSTIRRYNGIQKVEGVFEMVDAELKAKAYQKIVIFAIHRDVIEGLRSRLAPHNCVTLYGGTPAESRQKHIDRFQNDPKCRVFIGQIHAAGTAITLTAADQIIFIEQDWVPGNNMQAAMRCHRIGQTKPVTVRFVAIADSIDQKIATALRRKTAELARLFENERKSPTTLVQKDLTTDSEPGYEL